MRNWTNLKTWLLIGSSGTQNEPSLGLSKNPVYVDIAFFQSGYLIWTPCLGSLCEARGSGGTVERVWHLKLKYQEWGWAFWLTGWMDASSMSASQPEPQAPPLWNGDRCPPAHFPSWSVWRSLQFQKWDNKSNYSQIHGRKWEISKPASPQPLLRSPIRRSTWFV